MKKIKIPNIPAREHSVVTVTTELRAEDWAFVESVKMKSKRSTAYVIRCLVRLGIKSLAKDGTPRTLAQIHENGDLK